MQLLEITADNADIISLLTSALERDHNSTDCNDLNQNGTTPYMALQKAFTQASQRASSIKHFGNSNMHPAAAGLLFLVEELLQLRELAFHKRWKSMQTIVENTLPLLQEQASFSHQKVQSNKFAAVPCVLAEVARAEVDFWSQQLKHFSTLQVHYREDVFIFIQSLCIQIDCM